MALVATSSRFRVKRSPLSSSELLEVAVGLLVLVGRVVVDELLGDDELARDTTKAVARSAKARAERDPEELGRVRNRASR